jgi:signal transduction histidine kinase
MTDGRGSVLVVDDEAAQAKAICDILNRNGFPTTGCTSAEQALGLLDSRHYDLLLTDLMMPGTDGITLMRTALQADPTLVVLLMTGVGTVAQAVEAMKAGALDVILKPFKVTELLPAIAKALNVRALRIENARLQQSLRERTVAMERTLAIVAHDLRAPLQGICASIDLLTERNEVNASGLPLCKAVHQEARNLVDLATDLIDVSRIASGQMPWHWHEVDAGSLIPEVVAAFEGVSQQARVTLRAGPCAAPRIRGDHLACRRLLNNLVSNAIRHGRAAMITISAAAQDDGIRLTVADNGAGIDPGKAGRLGRPFAISGESSPFGGVGLGLAICLGIAAAHGGDLTIHSRMGQGTRIDVFLRGHIDQPQPAGTELRARLDLA